MKSNKLLGKYIIKGIIKVETGLHIGGSKSSLEIGGIDGNVIKVKTKAGNIPYIPGSSLKGKLRSLYAKYLGSSDIKSDSTKEFSKIANLFGYSGDDKKAILTPIIVRDAIMKHNDNIYDYELTEEKVENTIDRLTGTSNSGLRNIERVPRESLFLLEIIYDDYEIKDDNNKLNSNAFDQLTQLKLAMDLLEDDYLGGSGSRGYGQIKFVDIKCINKRIENYRYLEVKEDECCQIFNRRQ